MTYPFRNLPIFLNLFGLKQEDFDREYEKWKDENKDVHFSVYMENVFDNIKAEIKKIKDKKQKYHGLSKLYGQQIAQMIENRQKCNDLQRKKNWCELKEAEAQDYEYEVKVIGRPDCPLCSHEQPLVPLEVELKNQSIPRKGCPMLKRGYLMCTCVYGFKISSDENGLPKRKDV